MYYEEGMVSLYRKMKLNMGLFVLLSDCVLAVKNRKYAD